MQLRKKTVSNRPLPFPSELTLNRGCCKKQAGSSVCPPGSDYQVRESDNPPYTLRLTKCGPNEDLCNDGNGAGEAGSNDDGGGAVIVEGNESAAAFVKPAVLAIMMAATVAIRRS